MLSAKKTPVAATKKKVTESGRARIITKKTRRTVDNGSYISDKHHKTVSKPSSSMSTNNPGPAQHETSKDTILVYVAKINESRH